ncbi:hypothetical protein TWF694_009958 [Orbilia ellipsospora]|uniref:Rho GDP-dissociation inhibitor n=1 Tax=Orbilia ellipsospora TaxID=2528407 RepID=A0AAV9XIU7_9PEZI
MADNDELATSSAQGFKVGQEKSLNELHNLDAEDESLAKWKASLGLTADTVAAAVDPNDKRTVIIEELALEVEGRDDITVNLTEPGALEALKGTPFIVKEGSVYEMRIKFRVQGKIISGLKYVHIIKRKGIKVDKTEEMLGSYGPKAEPYMKRLGKEEAPSGMIARGSYVAMSRFTDDDKTIHLEFEWAIDIKKDWK